MTTKRRTAPNSQRPEQSSGITTLLLLPGLDGTGMIFEPLLTHLPQTIEARIVRYPTDHAISFQDHVDCAKKQLPKEKPFILLAESFSGPIGLQILAEPPKNLLGVILVATFACYPSPFLLDMACYLPQGPLLKFFSTALISRLFCLGGASDNAVKIFGKALTTVKLKVLSGRLEILAKLPPPPDTTFTGPCLYLQASNDRLVPARAVIPLKKQIPQLQVEQITGPHIILLAQPERGAQLISDFISTTMRSHE